MPPIIPPYSWVMKYKLYHIPFWLLYHYTWWSITIGSPVSVATLVASPYGIKTLFYIVFQAAGVYFNIYFLIPRLLLKGQNIAYIVSVITTTFATAGLVAPGYYMSSLISGRSMQELYGVTGNGYWRFYQLTVLPSTVTAMTVAMCVKLTKNWLSTLGREQALKNEKLETELKFLRSQFNPHFLFNTINSIFVLINKNPDRASEALAKFSELLRYQLYECNDQLIPLKRELGYVKNFIALEKLRQEKDLELIVDISNRSSSSTEIAPFMLVPFIENAFKHVARTNGIESRIRISLLADDHELQLIIRNSVDTIKATESATGDTSGIGLKNIQRRLSLLYPSTHKLTINETNGEFNVKLLITMSTIPEQSLNPAII